LYANAIKLQVGAKNKPSAKRHQGKFREVRRSSLSFASTFLARKP
jgi:hypothetical protein